MYEDQRTSDPYPNYGVQQDTDTASTLYATNPDRVFDDVFHFLKGEVYDPQMNDGKGDWAIPRGVTPLMNEKGANSFAHNLKGLLNQNTVLSNITDEKIVNRIMFAYLVDIHIKLEQRQKEFGIELADLDTAASLLEHLGFMCLMRPFHNLERIFHKSTLSEIRHYDPRMQAAGLANAKTEKKGWSLFGGGNK